MGPPQPSETFGQVSGELRIGHPAFEFRPKNETRRGAIVAAARLAFQRPEKASFSDLRWLLDDLASCNISRATGIAAAGAVSSRLEKGRAGDAAADLDADGR